MFLTKSKGITLNIDSAYSTGSHKTYMKYISFPWPPVVAAHERKTFAGALRSSAGSRRAILYTRYSVMSIRSHHSFQTVQNRSAIKIAVCYDNQ